MEIAHGNHNHTTLYSVIKSWSFWRFIVAPFALITLGACSQGPVTSDSKPETTTSETVKLSVSGEPVNDLLSLAKALDATDTSYLSIDAAGVYGIIVNDRIHYFRYLEEGWVDESEQIFGGSTDTDLQQIDGLVVEKGISVTTRDYTGDRKNDFLVAFGSGFSEYGAVITMTFGKPVLLDFCLIYESPDRPGKLRTKVLEDLGFEDDIGWITGSDYSSDGNSYTAYWGWSPDDGCFMNSANR